MIDMGAYEYQAPVPVQFATGNETISNGQSGCYNATQTITVAGNGNQFKVEVGGNAEMIAGQNILLLAGTIVEPGGYLYGHIAPGGPWCATQSIPSLAMAENKIPGSTLQSPLKVYPNPTTGNFILELTGEVDNVTVDIYGMCGEKVLTEVLCEQHKHEFSLSDKPNGIYFVRITTGGKAETAKIIKQ